MSATEPAIRPLRRFRWLQFSLRSLLLVILVGSLGLAWYSRELRRRERIERAIELLAKAPSQYSGEYDPIALVRAVNALQGLGKDDAIVALRRFAARYPSFGDSDSPHLALTLVLPLLFDRENPEDSYPSEWRWATYNRDSPIKPLFVQDGIPFRYLEVSLLGEEGDLVPLINWTELHGRIRPVALRPSDDPLGAADELIRSLIEKARSPYVSPEQASSNNGRLTRVVRKQALRAVAHLTEISTENLPPVGPENEGEWLRLKAECRRLGIRWSEEKQEYVATNGAP